VNQTHHYRADAATCNACPLKAKCTTSEEGRPLRRSFYQEYLDHVAAYHQTKAYKKAYQKRKVWIEPLFGEGQQWHGLRRFRLRGLVKVNCEGVLTATGQTSNGCCRGVVGGAATSQVQPTGLSSPEMTTHFSHKNAVVETSRVYDRTRLSVIGLNPMKARCHERKMRAQSE